MPNELREENNNLAKLDYTDWLDRIIAAVQGEPGSEMFSAIQAADGRIRLIVNFHDLAYHLAKDKRIRLPLDEGEKAYRATINMTDECSLVFKERIRTLKAALFERLTEAIGKTIGLSKDGEALIDELTRSILVSLNQINKKPSLFAREFHTTSGLRAGELILDSEEAPIIQSHKVTIQINKAKQFRDSLIKALENYINVLIDDDDEDSGISYVDMRNIQASINSLKTKDSPEELVNVERLIKEETIGRLKREAEVAYLELSAKAIWQDCQDAAELNPQSKIIHQRQNPYYSISRHQASVYLKDYSRRLRLLDRFIRDPNRPEGYYDITYQGVKVNIQELFSQGNAFSELPLIAQIKGYIGETEDISQDLAFGLKFKLNGEVNNPVHYDSSFAYGLATIDPDSKLHKEGLEAGTQWELERHIKKIIKFFVLYYFAFSCPNPLDKEYDYGKIDNYNPIEKFEEMLLELKEQGKARHRETEEPASEKRNGKKKDIASRMRGFVRGMNEYLVSDKLAAMVRLLKEYLQKEFVLSERRDIYIVLSQQLLIDDLSEISSTGRFFREDLHSGNLKKCLKYVFISEQSTNRNALLQLPVTLKLETDLFYSKGNKYQFQTSPQTKDIQMLPVVHRFLHENSEVQFERDRDNAGKLARCLSLRKDVGEPQNAAEASDLLSRIVYPGSIVEFQVQRANLEKAKEKQRYIYELTLKTLGSIFMEILTSNARKNSQLFVAQWILHETTKDKTTQQETLVRQMVKEWNHILGQDILAKSQGIEMPTINIYKINNAKNSLYSMLPQESRSRNRDDITLDRLLIIMVSSNKCDARSSRQEEDYRANLTGEIVAVEKTENGGLKVSRVKTIAENYWNYELYSQPAVLRDAINAMYEKGFRHVLYIAKTPFSQHLRITASKKELFFMSQESIKFLKTREDLVIYPVLYDSYNAVRVDGKVTQETFYVQDVRQLDKVFKDPNLSQVIFFNLFTGQTIEPERTFYNAVTTYSTLLNAHPDIIDVNKVMKGLIQPDSLKNDIMLCLTLFHYSKYEKKRSSKEEGLLKLDPLNDIIGDNAIGRSSAKSPHCIASAQMNYIAFMTEVYKALRVEESNSISEDSENGDMNNYTGEKFNSISENLENGDKRYPGEDVPF